MFSCIDELAARPLPELWTCIVSMVTNDGQGRRHLHLECPENPLFRTVSLLPPSTWGLCLACPLIPMSNPSASPGPCPFTTPPWPGPHAHFSVLACFSQLYYTTPGFYISIVSPPECSPPQDGDLLSLGWNIVGAGGRNYGICTC